MLVQLTTAVQKSDVNSSHKKSVTNWRCVLQVAKTSCSFEFLAWPSYIKDKAILLGLNQVGI